MNVRITLKMLMIMFFVFYASFCFAQDESAQLIDTLSQDSKIIEPELVMDDFLQGEVTTRVIVNLSEPALFEKNRNFKDSTFRKNLQGAVRAVQDQVISRLDPAKVRVTNTFVYIFGFSAEVSLDGLKELTEIEEVISINKDRILHEDLAQGIPLINASTVRTTYNGSGMAIAVCDTGIDYTHPRLGGGGFPNSKVIGGRDCGDNDNDPLDCRGHGTCCAGIAAGDLGTVGDYIGGVAYNAKLYALKMVQGCEGSADESDMIEAWDWCVVHQNDDPNNPIMVISTSFSGGYYTSSCDSASPAMTTAAANAVAAGITIFNSSGNSGFCDGMGWPACITNVNAVGAVYDANIGPKYGWCISPDSCIGYSAPGCPLGWACDDTSTFADLVTCYSNTAAFLDLFAPNNNAYTTDIVGAGGYNTTGDYYSTFGGTSAACPYAAGAAACLQNAAKSIQGSFLTPAVVRSLLASTGDLITDTKQGHINITKPRVNLGAAVDELLVDICECDLNHDGSCDMQDWLLFGEDWGRTDCPIPPTMSVAMKVAPNNNILGDPDAKQAEGTPVFKHRKVENAMPDGDQTVIAPPQTGAKKTAPAVADIDKEPKTPAAPTTPIWSRLDNLPLSDKENAVLQLEVAGDLAAYTVADVKNVENLWNSGNYTEAIEALEALEAGGVAVAAGISWKSPKGVEGLQWWEGDVRIGARENIIESHLDFDAETGNLFAVLRYNVGSDYYWSVNISTDNGQTWQETYEWHASYEIKDTSAAVVADYLYVGYVGDTAFNSARIRRCSVSTGQIDGGYGWHQVFDKGVEINEIALCTDTDSYDNRVYYYAILNNNNLILYWTDQDGGVGSLPWSEWATGVAFASHGLDATWNEGCDSWALFVSFVSTGSGNPVYVWRTNGAINEAIQVEPDPYSGTPTGISAYDDNIITVFEYRDESNNQGIKYWISYNGGDTWLYWYVAEAEDGRVFHEPDVAARKGGGIAAVYQEEVGEPDFCWYTRRDYSGSWSTPEQFNEIDVYTGSSMEMEFLPPLPGNAYAHGSIWISRTPMNGAYFDRSDGESDICECDLNHDGSCDMQDWLIFGEDWGRTDCPIPGECIVDQEQLIDDYGYWFELPVVRWQEFFPEGNRICRVDVKIYRTGNPASDVLLAIEDDGGTTLWSTTIPQASVPIGVTWVLADVPDIIVNPGGSYKLKVWSDGPSPNAQNRYFWKSTNNDDVYPGSSSADPSDFTFRTYKRSAVGAK